MLNWIKEHFSTLFNLQLNVQISDQNQNELGLEEGCKRYVQTVQAIRGKNAKLMFVGNGGSAGIASHVAIDYSKNGRMPALTFTDGAALTCLSNDLGYEHAFARQIEFHGRKDDVLIAISSSGKSPNILNAVKAARHVGCQVMTFSGFEKGNPLSKVGDVNFYVNSNDYGLVEVAHVALVHAMLDYILHQEKENQPMQEAQNAKLTVI